MVFLAACFQQNYQGTVQINDAVINVEVADTYERHYKGLSGTDKLCGNCGMLFIFGDKQAREFVMRDMNYPLDIIWIDDDKVIKIDEDLPPEGWNPKTIYSSGIPVNYVLEVNAGFCRKHDITVGKRVVIIRR